MKKYIKKGISRFTSTGMKKIFSSILILFIFVSLFLPFTKTFAVDYFLDPITSTGPENNTINTVKTDVPFTFTFITPIITNKTDIKAPNENYNVWFWYYCVVNGVETASKERTKIFSGSKLDSDKTMTMEWKIFPNCPFYTNSLHWFVAELDSTGKPLKTYVDKTFDFIIKEGLKGYYYITYDNNTGIYKESDKFANENLCKTSSNSFINKNPNFKIYSECKYYDDLPNVPRTDPSVAINAKINVAENKSIYTMLVPIGKITHMDSSGSDACKNDPTCIPNDIGKYLNIIFRLAIGICAALAVVMLIINGITYMGDESIFAKTEAKKKMFGAIIGLLIALGAWALLNTINPALTGKGGLNISAAEIEIAGDTDVPINFNKNTLPTGIVCSGGKANIPNIVSSFAKKMTYEMGAKGVAGPENTIKLDCSGFVNYVLRCADINAISGGTASIFSNAEKVIQTSIQGTKINNKELNIGDLVGWRAGENGEKFGHVMIYIGNGQLQLADSHGTKVIGGALGTFPISKYQPRIKYVKRIP